MDANGKERNSLHGKKEKVHEASDCGNEYFFEVEVNMLGPERW